MYYAWMDSPVGKLLVAGDQTGLRQVSFANGRAVVQPDAGWRENRRQVADAIRQLRDYFAGTRRQFDLPLAPEGTPFQKRVWQELLRIPYGETMSYGELARQVGNANASRAVGLANGANPIAIVIPCHRVIGTNGKLTGYGGGLDTKQWLLALEKGRLPLD